LSFYSFIIFVETRGSLTFSERMFATYLFDELNSLVSKNVES
jgi:hypothetical protein